MKKVRTTSWFLLLVILLAIFVSFTMAQETPTAAGGQVFLYDLAEPLSGEPLAHSSEVIQIELSAASQSSLSLPAVSLNLAPAAGEDASQEPRDPVDTTVVPLPDELQNSLVPGGSSLTDPVAVPFGSEHRFDFSGRHVGLPQPSPSPSAADDTCKQLLDNTKLDMIGGSFPPWVILNQKVYFSDTNYKSAQHSLLFVDNDSGDTSPTLDAFAQAFSAPSNLTKVTIEYYTRSYESNSGDKALGNIYTVDAEDNLDEFLFGWVVGESGTWQHQFATITDKAILQSMEGQNLAIVLFNVTTGSAPGEVVFFDDISFTACQPDVPDSHIIVKKKTDPAGASQKFTFNPSWSSSNFQLSDGQSKTSKALSPGTYSVKELAKSGWKLDGATCSDGSNPKSISLQAGETVTCTFKNVKEIADNCSQLLVNTKMDVVELGGGKGTAEPWVIPFPNVYYTNNPDLAYDGYSMVLVDGDDGDPSPEIDMFAQGFQMPGNLTEIRIEYQRKTLGTNPTDKVFGELYLLDDDWTLHWPSEKYGVAGWVVAESEGKWGKQIILSNDQTLLSKMTGKKMAVLLFNITDGGGEDVFFDNVMLTACSKGEPASGKVFMPSIMHNFGEAAEPICTPPPDPPFDMWNSNRGLVQTGATCSSTLDNNFDLIDYYTFKPSEDGNHTLRLTNLPDGTQWSATMLVDSDPYPFAPGGADGNCFTSQPGHGNKEVLCNLNKGTEYFVRIDSGSTPVSGGYKMNITAP